MGTLIAHRAMRSLMFLVDTNMKKILAINPGSTAVKYTLFDERSNKVDEWQYTRKNAIGVTQEERDRLAALRDVTCASVRVVHGDTYSQPTPLTEEVRAAIERGKLYAPIHNTHALEVFALIHEALPHVRILCVFDTHFHRALPPHARTYPIPLPLAQQHHLFRRGFHGLAIESVLAQLVAHCKNSNEDVPKKIIVAHLGGGSSITAVNDGESVDTTMGLTPLEGIMMITRSGSIDPDLPRILAKKTMQTSDAISALLNENSGFVGLTGSEDTLEIITRAANGEEPYKLAFDIFVHQVVKQIYAYVGVLQGVDALVFSGGIGFGNEYFRNTVLAKLTLLGINEKNTYAIATREEEVLLQYARGADIDA